jgi:hypothetical protein
LLASCDRQRAIGFVWLCVWVNNSDSTRV